MRKIILCVLAVAVLISGYGCQNDTKKADEYSKGFIEAMLLKDEENMKKYLHPQYSETAIPDEEFYKDITEKYFFTAGNSLDAIYAIGKSNFPVGENEPDGERYAYKYTVLSNELYYDIDIIIFENEEGYGITGFSFALNTNPQLYTPVSEVK